jgi:DNA-binding transcriptional ArsR family regulator
MSGLEDRDGLSETSEPPQGPEREGQGDRVLVLPVNGDSRKITQILSNETSLKILEVLGKKSMSATNIAEELNLPLTTVKYNLDSLAESDLIKVKQIKWSQKGRQVKIYESVEKLIVLGSFKEFIRQTLNNRQTLNHKYTAEVHWGNRSSLLRSCRNRILFSIHAGKKDL